MGILNLLGVLSPAHIRLATMLKGGRHVGTDPLGNRYYSAPPKRGYRHDQRWVLYKGEPEASKVPPEWHGWLHHQTDQVPSSESPSYRQQWQKPHQENLTGTLSAYRPKGHILNKGVRAAGTGDYEPWTPEQ